MSDQAITARLSGKRRAFPVALVLSALVLLVSVSAVVSVGAVTVPTRVVWGVIADNLLPGLVTPDWSLGRNAIVWELRLPRALLVATGLVLGVALVARASSADRLVLVGVAVSFSVMAAANVMMFLGDPRATHTVVFWMLGSLASRNGRNWCIR